MAPVIRIAPRPPLAAVRRAAAAAVVAASVFSGCRGACSRDRGQAGEGAVAAAVLAALPAETRVVLAADFAQLRRAPLWPELAALGTADPADKARIEEFARRTGLDPLSQIDALMLAFPEEARTHGELALVLRGRGFDENRLLAYVRDQVARDGDELFTFERSGRRLWATRAQPTTAGFFADERTFVLGAGGWAEKMAALLPPPPGRPAAAATAPGAVAPRAAAGNPELVRLVERAGPARAVWAAAIVPAATRDALARDPLHAAAAGINHLALSLDVAPTVEARLIADLATPAQAADLARRVNEAVAAAKQSREVLLLGLGPHLGGISAGAQGPSCTIDLKLASSDAAQLLQRLRAYLSLIRRGPIPGFR
jgi:hypothetical protein